MMDRELRLYHPTRTRFQQEKSLSPFQELAMYACTSWVGQHGRDDIHIKNQRELMQPKLDAMKHELKTLASVCINAFEAGGLMDSPDKEVKKAVDLCHSHLPQSSSSTQPSRSSRISTL